MCHPQGIRSRQLMRHDVGNMLKYQDNRQGLRTLPLNAMGCGYFLIKPERDQGFLKGPVPKELITVVLVDSQRKDMALPQDQLPSPYNSTLAPIKDDELDPRVPDLQRLGEFLPHRVLTFPWGW
jgi:hypothetical protein